MFGWISKNGNGDRSRRPADATPITRLQGAGCGIVEGTLVATDGGWVPIETVEVGERILTFDGGMQQCRSMIHDQIWSGPSCPQEFWPLRVARDTIGNRHDMLVMPAQGVLIESDTVTDAFGDPFAVIPGAALDVLQGVSRHKPRPEVALFMPVFDEDQIVFADNGALMFCQNHWGLSAGILPRYGVAGNYNMLPLDLAKRVLAKGDFGEILDYSVAVF